MLAQCHCEHRVPCDSCSPFLLRSGSGSDLKRCSPAECSLLRHCFWRRDTTTPDHAQIILVYLTLPAATSQLGIYAPSKVSP